MRSRLGVDATQPDPGAESDIRTLHDRHAAALQRWARRRFADPREAEEVVQDTLVLAWRKQDKFDPDRGTERAWLFGILRNVAASHHRKGERRLSIVSPLLAVDPTVSGDAELEAELDASEIADAVAGLKPEHQAVIIGAYFRGLRLKALAVELGVPEGTVKSRLYYALRALRTALEERGVLA